MKKKYKITKTIVFALNVKQLEKALSFQKLTIKMSTLGKRRKVVLADKSES